MLENLSDSEKVQLISGKGMWHTNDLGGKLESIHLSDGPHGLRKQDENVIKNNDSYVSTCFPAACASACSWDTDMLALMAAGIAKEAVNEKVSVVLGPGVNIKRSPLCGRNFEYFSEDPYLSGTLAAAYINKMQEYGVGASLKHFAGNSQETHRQTANSQIDERALREIYLTAFEIAVKNSNPATIMASYNRLNGEYACENEHLLKDILRDEWGYDGAVISDWGACVDLAKCIKAGMDLEMPDSLGIHAKQLEKELKKDKALQAELERACMNVQKLVEKCSAGKRIIKRYDVSENHEVSRKIECNSAVLLKNDGFLPLKADAHVLVIGSLAEKIRFQGGGSSHINTADFPNAIEALKASGIKVTYVKGYKANKYAPNIKLENEAVKAAESGLPILFFGGLTDISEGEGYDRKSFEMPENQKSLLGKILAVNRNIAFISFGGSPYNMYFENDVRAILNMYLGGEAVGEACADLITGKVNPSGKLAETIPYSEKDTPCHKWYADGSDDVEYRESIFVGYRYYDTFGKKVRFPFGFGLSYTTFEYSDLKIGTDKYKGGKIAVTFSVKNTGGRFGKETAQIYVKNPKGGFLRANKELRGFIKIPLERGEQREVSVTLDERSFSVFDAEKNNFIIPGGDYEIIIAASVNDERLKASISVDGAQYDRDDRKRLSDYFNKDFDITKEQFELLYGRPLSEFSNIKRGEYSTYSSISQLAQKSLPAKIMLNIVKLGAYIIYLGKPRDDPEVMMFVEGIVDGTIDCVVCQSGGLVKYKTAEALVLSANGHKREAFKKFLRG